MRLAVQAARVPEFSMIAANRNMTVPHWLLAAMCWHGGDAINHPGLGVRLTTPMVIALLCILVFGALQRLKPFLRHKASLERTRLLVAQNLRTHPLPPHDQMLSAMVARRRAALWQDSCIRMVFPWRSWAPVDAGVEALATIPNQWPEYRRFIHAVAAIDDKLKSNPEIAETAAGRMAASKIESILTPELAWESDSDFLADVKSRRQQAMLLDSWWECWVRLNSTVAAGHARGPILLRQFTTAPISQEAVAAMDSLLNEMISSRGSAHPLL